MEIFDIIMEELSKDDVSKFDELSSRANKAIKKLKSDASKFNAQCKKIDAYIKAHPNCKQYDEKTADEFNKVSDMVYKAQNYFSDFEDEYYSITEYYKQSKSTENSFYLTTMSLSGIAVSLASIPFIKLLGLGFTGFFILSFVATSNINRKMTDKDKKMWRKKFEEWLKENPNNFYKALDDMDEVVEKMKDEFYTKYSTWSD